MTTRAKGERPIDIVLRSINNSRKPVRVEPWGLTLYFPPLTTATMIAVEERLGIEGVVVGMDGNSQPAETPTARKHRKHVTMLVLQAQLEDGSQAFDTGDVEMLMQKVDFVTMQQLIGAMFSTSMPATTEEAKEDSETTAS